MDHRRDCQCPIFAQSRSLEHVVTFVWRDVLFDLLIQRPINTTYSIAFSLSFTPTFLLSDKIDDDRSRKAYLTASRELYDLLDDYVRDTDYLNMNEILRTRSVTARTTDPCLNEVSVKLIESK